MSNKTKKSERRFGNFFFCCKQEFDVEGIKKHLLEAHKIDADKTQGVRGLVSHMDGSDWYSWDYTWEYGDVNFTQHSCQKRSKASRMYHED